jgi:hypothetical protein
MKKFSDLFFRLVEFLLVVMLSAMVIMVFGNVVLRYGFNDSIISSEELSRFLFIWITFLGAIVTLRENAHLGVDTVVRKLGLRQENRRHRLEPDDDRLLRPDVLRHLQATRHQRQHAFGRDRDSHDLGLWRGLCGQHRHDLDPPG